MESTVFGEIEEFQTEDIMSYNHAKITYRLTKMLSRYDEQFDILPELEFELSHGRAKPDVAICKIGKIDWLRDIIRPTHPPLLAIEILSPRQALSDLTDKALDVYFPSGTSVVWIIIPHFRQVTVMIPDNQKIVISGLLSDENTGIELSLDRLFEYLYSDFIELTGFIKAARMAWELTVSKAIQTAKTPAVKNIHHEISIRYANSVSHWLMA